MTRTTTVTRTIAELANLTGKSFIVLEVDHASSSPLRVAEEFRHLSPDIVDAILETNLGIVEIVSAIEAEATYREFESTFPMRTPTGLIASLIRPKLQPLRFTQGSGFGRTTEGFRSGARAYALAYC